MNWNKEGKREEGRGKREEFFLSTSARF